MSNKYMVPNYEGRYEFSERSLKNLRQCHPLLQDLFKEVIKYFDCSVIEGYRNSEKQMQAFHAGHTSLAFPNSKHNKKPSLAVDVVPYPVEWEKKERFYYFAGQVKGISYRMGIKIRWGGDWDGDNNFNDQSFHDLPHFELIT